ncbi:MAG: tetratricopeptide repeat protein [Verrucomicrobia bacterium]|nr:tetratricopeptide repeat protein [Verrucomicrobiota bacterium]
MPRVPRSASSSPASPAVPPGRRWAFRLVAMTLPVLVLLAVELGMRWSGGLRPTEFWIPASEPGRWMPNPAFASRFVGPSLARMPRSATPAATPASNTLRILVFGESAALGDPEPAFGFSRFLQALLEARLPDRRIEVINTAVTALNSHAIREAARDSRRLSGDFWVIYAGNNEIIGPWGPAATPTGSGPSPAGIRLAIAARQTAVGQWLADRSARSAGGLSLTQKWTGLEGFLERPIPPDHPALPQTRAAFAANLRDIIRTGLGAGARILVGTMAVNLPDCPPLGSRWSTDTNLPGLGAWAAAVDAARAADDAADVTLAVSAWTNAVALRPDDAESRFRLGQARLNAGEFSEGRRDLERARDLDPLRFRADSGILQATREVAATFPADQVLLVDADRDLRGTETNRPPGADLFFEHVHLRPEGSYALAKLFAESVIQSLGTPAGPGWSSFNDCLTRLGWTPFAASRLWGQVRTLTQRPPFSRQSHALLRDRYLDDRIAEANAEARGLGLNAAIGGVRTMVERHPEDWELREQLMRLLVQARQWTNAVTEGREIVRRAPGHVVGWLQLGESLSQAGDRPEAARAYREAVRIRPDFVEARLGLARVLNDSGQSTEALAEVDQVLGDSPDQLQARVQRGLTLIALQRFDDGVAELRRAASEHPNSPLPLVRLAEAQTARKAHAEAARAYTEALTRDPRNPVLHHRLGLEHSRAGQASAAEAALREAVRLAPEAFTPRLDLGVVLAQQARFQDAIPQFEAALRLEPANAVARQYLDLARRKLQEGGGN